MRKWLRVSGLAAVLLASGGSGAEAQLGPLLDWIHKLSGPGFVRVGVAVPLAASAAAPDRRPATVLRLAPYYGWSTHEGNNGGLATEDMSVLSPQVEVQQRLLTIGRAVEVEGVLGFAAHWFHASDDIDAFWHVSVPAVLYLRPRFGGKSGPVAIGTGAQIFFPFPDDAFAPLPMDVSTDALELAWTISVAIDAIPATIF